MEQNELNKQITIGKTETTGNKSRKQFRFNIKYF